MLEVIVAGCGPAGASLAAELVTRGAHVTVVAPAPDAPWPNTYAVFEDELVSLGLEACAERVWPRTIVGTDKRTIEVGRGYARIDPAKLRARYFDRFADKATIVEGRVDGLGPTGVRTDDGRVIEADVVVDARGTPYKDGAAAQVAYGIEAIVGSHDFDLETAVMMDFSTDAWPDERDRPTFLYALPLAKDRLFLEETSLAAQPPHAIEDLEARLAKRLAKRGVEVKEIVATERCFIRLDVEAPGATKVVPFGAAAGFVHPATGYSIVRSLGAAPVVAEAIVTNPDPTEIVRAAWSDTDRVAHDLYVFGRDVLCGLDADGLQDFLDAFFETGVESCAGFLGRTASKKALAQTMNATFAGLSPRTKFAVARRLAAKSGLRAVRSLLLGPPDHSA